MLNRNALSDPATSIGKEQYEREVERLMQGCNVEEVL